MTRKGVVFKVKSRSLIVMTGDFEFQEIKKRGPAQRGQEIVFHDGDVVSCSGRWRLIGTAVSLLLVLLVSVGVMKGFLVREVYAYVGLDINPSLELALDRELKVLRAAAGNEDGRRVLQGLALRGLPVAAAVTAVLEACGDRGYLAGDTPCILITATVVDDPGAGEYQGSLEDQLLGRVRAALEKGHREANIYVLRAGLKEREQARDRGLSTGRYLLWKKAREAGVDLPLEQVISRNVGEVMQRDERVQAAIAKSAAARWEKRGPAFPPAPPESTGRDKTGGAGPEPKPGLAPEPGNDKKTTPAAPTQPRTPGHAGMNGRKDDKPFAGGTPAEGPPERGDREQAPKPAPAPDREAQGRPTADGQAVPPPFKDGAGDDGTERKSKGPAAQPATGR